MKGELAGMGFELSDSESAVIAIFVRDNERTLEFWRMLLEDYSVYTNPFISPGVRPRHSLLRTSYMATHEREHLDRGLEALRSAGKALAVI